MRKSSVSSIVHGLVDAINESVETVNNTAALWNCVRVNFARDIPINIKEIVAQMYRKTWRHAYWSGQTFFLIRQ